jgi:hypothetical protein
MIASAIPARWIFSIAGWLTFAVCCVVVPASADEAPASQASAVQLEFAEPADAEPAPETEPAPAAAPAAPARESERRRLPYPNDDAYRVVYAASDAEC